MVEKLIVDRKQTGAVRNAACRALILALVVGATRLILGGGPAAHAEPVLLEGIAAQVDEEIILESEVYEQVAVARMQFAVPDSSLPQLREEILGRMIDEKIIILEARTQGVTVSEQEVEQAVEQYMTRIKGNLGSDEALERELANEGMTYEGLLERYRDEARQEILYSRLVQREIYSQIEVTDEDVEAYYEEHRAELPEKEEQVRLAHVFVGVRPSDDVITSAQGKLDQVGRRIEAGEEFGDIARELSDDPGTRDNGGDLGWFKRGQLDAQFEGVVYALEPGQVSEPFQTVHGVELVRLIEKDEVEDRVHAQHILILLRATQTDLDRARSTAARVLQLARSGVDMATLAEKYSDDDNSKTKGGDLGMFKGAELVPFVAEAVNGLGVGDISEVVQTEQGFHVFRVTERHAGGTYTLPEVFEQLRNSLGEERASALTKEWLGEIRGNYYIRRADAAAPGSAGALGIDRRPGSGGQASAAEDGDAQPDQEIEP